jgi:ribosomal protein S18 acetylase RimI-like enzyme
MDFRLVPATTGDAPELAILHTAVAAHLTSQFGKGHWSSRTSVKGALYALRTTQVFVMRDGGEIVAALRLTRKRPWAIDASHFTATSQPLYLIAMAVSPKRQRQGIGRQCLKEAARIARELKGDALRLSSYDSPAGAGGFYQSCGYREVGRKTYRETPLVYFELVLGGIGSD